ncbi:DoxX family protein [Haladaptatus caseinilyticus]|uniref:DoxX family protein n=1 Tax=Haladaptatus caseinilyticus TaxID=2993314 RepID=UPI00224AFA45|nr:DoxX family protein [Haladaptatus caseinilyticus]
MSTIETAILVVQGLLGLIMVASGGVKFIRTDFHTTQFEQFGYPQWFLVVAGGVEVLGGLGLLAGLVFTPILGVLGGFLIAVTMIGAILTHLIRVDDPLSASTPAAVFLVAGLIVTISRLLSFQL